MGLLLNDYQVTSVHSSRNIEAEKRTLNFGEALIFRVLIGQLGGLYCHNGT